MKKNILLLFLAIGNVAISQIHDYGLAQKLSTRFYGAQRCGDTKSHLHGACHTTDGKDAGVELTGGWHDCGDYLKFNHTGAYAAVALLQAYTWFPESYPDEYAQDYSSGLPNGVPDILDEVKIYTDYLLKCLHGGKVY
ncbi:MAG: hypothetical protein ACJA0Q_001835 [Saprospiraceae bacterium]|jgi:hypothetical protein